MAARDAAHAGGRVASAGWVFIFALRYEADGGRISAVILWTTALAFLTFSALVWVLGVGKPG